MSAPDSLWDAARERAEETLRKEHETARDTTRSAETWRSRARLLARDVRALLAELEKRGN